MKALDVGALLDHASWSRYQKALVFGTALIVILDGVDNQLLPNALPSLIREWKEPRAAFTSVLVASPLGMMVGGALGGMLGDRIGRRSALLFSALSFALLTLAVAFADSLFALGAFRFLAGMGLGGAMPNAAALVSEYVPKRQRPVAVTLTVLCVPLGGTLAALLAGAILPSHSWRVLFVIGGLMPILLGLLLFRILPESPQYLAGRPERWPELTALLNRLGFDVPPDTTYAQTAGADVLRARASWRELLAPAFRRDTIGLFGAFFFGLMANYIGFLLIPAMLTGAGFAPIVGTNANAAFNFGGVGGAVVGALLIQRLGSRLTMLGLSALAIASALVMAAMPLTLEKLTALIVMFAVTGGLLNAVQTTMFALATHVYPTEIRGTGIGAAVAFGRIGNVLAAYAGGFALDRGGPPGYFASWAVAMLLVFVSLAMVRRHIPRSSTQRLPVPAQHGRE